MKHTINTITLTNGDVITTSDRDLSAAILEYTQTVKREDGLNLGNELDFFAEQPATGFTQIVQNIPTSQVVVSRNLKERALKSHNIR